MFKFNFNNEEDESQNDKKESNIQWYESKEVNIPSNILSTIKSIPRNQILKLDYNDRVSIFCLSTKEAMNMLKEKSNNEEFLDVLKADKEHSDLLSGKYEGGLKTWECTKNLVLYLLENEIEFTEKNLKGKNILDLGCGSGILGILGLFSGADVTFQDYNQEVLEAMTIPNIFINFDESVKERVKLYSGDWSWFLELMIQKSTENSSKNVKFDYILTSETIYNPANYNKLIEIFQKLLKPDGVAFVAAKTHYFGVGGNLFDFSSSLENSGLHHKVCWKTNEGVSRGIIKVSLQNNT